MKRSNRELMLPCRVCGLETGLARCVLAAYAPSRVDSEKVVKEYQRGQVLFYEGTPPLAVYCIHSGRVKLFKVGRKREELVIRLLGPSDIVGYRPLLAGENYAATAEVMEKSTICVISRELFLELLRTYPDLSFAFMAKLAEELRVSEEQILMQTQESVRQRTARLLLKLWDAARSNADDKDLIAVKAPLRIEMAQIVATTPETLSRTLRSLANQGLIRLERSGITITNPGALRTIAAEDS